MGNTCLTSWIDLNCLAGKTANVSSPKFASHLRFLKLGIARER